MAETEVNMEVGEELQWELVVLAEEDMEVNMEEVVDQFNLMVVLV